MQSTEDLLKQLGVEYFIVHLDKRSPKKIQKTKYNIFKKFNIEHPWYHQERTIELVKSEKNVILLSGTGSGKTEAAVGSILESINIEKNKNCQVLFIYPTKALTNDQLDRLKRYFSGYNVCAFDADNENRKREVSRSEIVITNPQMLFMHLKYETQFIYFLRNLKFIVVDEFHLYDPYQLSMIYAMLKYLINKAKNDIKIIFLSATIGNYQRLCKELNKLSMKWECVLGNAYQEEMNIFVLKNTNNLEVFDILKPLIKTYLIDNKKMSTIVFVPYVGMANRLASKFKDEFKEYSNLVAAHHGKLSAEDRKTIERKIRNGEIRVCFTTKTLQQGIDIGYLNRVIHVGLPETISEFKQRQGRVGRRPGQIAESIIIPFFPSDYEYISNRNKFIDYLSQNPESVIYNENSFAFKLVLAYFKSPEIPDESVVKSLEKLGIAKEKIDIESYLVTGEIKKELQITDYGRDIFNLLSFYGQGSLKTLYFKDGKVVDEGQISFQDALTNALPGCIIYEDGVPWYVSSWSKFPQNIFEEEKEIKINCIEISKSPYKEYANMIKEGMVGTYVKFDPNKTKFKRHFSIFGELYLVPSKIYLLDYSKEKVSLIKTMFVDSYPRLPILTNSIHLQFDKHTSYELAEYALHAFQRSIRTVHNIAPTLFQHVVYENDGQLEGYFYEVTLGNVLPQLDVERISKEAIRMDKNEASLWLPRCNFKIGVHLNDNDVNRCISTIAKQIKKQIEENKMG